MRIAVLGVGLIGGSIGLAAREQLDDAEVVGFGRDPGGSRRASSSGAIDRAADSIEAATEGADAVLRLRLRWARCPSSVRAALAAAGDDCVVTDVGSTKRGLRPRSTTPRFVGGHPIAGAETAGVEHARADLFQGAVWYLTPLPHSGGLLYERLHRFVVDVGARPSPSTPRPTTGCWRPFSHLPHVVANVLVSQAAARARAGRGAAAQVGPSFRDATRVAGANSAIWTDIYRANRERHRRGDRAPFGANWSGVEQLLAAGDVADWNDAAREARRALLEPDLGRGPLHELRIDRPQPPRYRRPGGAGARQGGGQHRGPGAGAGVRHALGRDDALDRGRLPGRPRGRADRRRSAFRVRRAVTAARFEPATGPLRGDYAPPPDKSISHRAALFGAMADEPVTVRNFLESQDTRSTLDALLGSARRSRSDGRRAVLIRGVGLHARAGGHRRPLDVGNSGTLLRLLPGGSPGSPAAVDARRRRVDPPPPGRPDRGAAAADGRRASSAAKAASRRSACAAPSCTGSTYELPVPAPRSSPAC